jgi:hypothetical protein
MKEISYLKGTNHQLLVIAPHREEAGTGKIARKLSKQLNCPAIINERIKRKDSDLNNFEAAVKHPDFINALNNWAEIKRTDRPLAIWLHGHGSLKGPQCVVGDGNPASPVANLQTVETLIEKLTEHGISCVRAMPFMINLAAQTQDNMAQYFKRHDFDVNSVQIEISKQLRGMLLVDFVKALNSALQVALQAVAESKATSNNLPKGKVSVDEAASQVIEICSGHLFEAALEVGRYFVNTLYKGDYERARDPRNNLGVLSFNRVCERVRAQGGPSKRWLYNALKLAVNEHDYGKMAAYSKLSLSNKIELFRLDDKPVAKKALIERSAETDMTVIELRDEIREYLDTEPPLEAQEYILVDKIRRLLIELDRKCKKLEEVRRKLGK